MRHLALRLAVESVLDDLIESGNGMELDTAWVAETVKRLIEARDTPEVYLRNAPRLRGSWLDVHYPKVTE